jgi:hypothetical protein
LSFDPSSNCIVSQIYSGSAGVGSTNNQSLFYIPQPPSIATRISVSRTHIDNVIYVFTGLVQSLLITEYIKRLIARNLTSESLSMADTTPRRMVARRINESTLSILDRISLRGVFRTITQSLVLAGTVAIWRPRFITDSLSLADSATRIQGRVPTESLSLTETPQIKLSRKLTAEALTIADACVRAWWHTRYVTDGLILSDGVGRFYKAFRSVVEGRCSLLFNGLGPTP